MTSGADCLQNCRVQSQERGSRQHWQSHPSVLMKWAAWRSSGKSSFEILFWGKFQWHVGNSSQFLSTPVSGPWSIARKNVKKKDANCKIRSLKFQAQFTCASALAHQSFSSSVHKRSMMQSSLKRPGLIRALSPVAAYLSFYLGILLLCHLKAFILISLAYHSFSLSSDV